MGLFVDKLVGWGKGNVMIVMNVESKMWVDVLLIQFLVGLVCRCGIGLEKYDEMLECLWVWLFYMIEVNLCGMVDLILCYVVKGVWFEEVLIKVWVYIL